MSEPTEMELVVGLDGGVGGGAGVAGRKGAVNDRDDWLRRPAT